MENNGKGFAVAALVLGIIATILAWFYLINIIAVVCGIIGIVLAAKGKKAAVAAGGATGMATAGMVLSIIGLSLSVIGFFSCTLCVACAGGAAAELAKSLPSSLQ